MGEIAISRIFLSHINDYIEPSYGDLYCMGENLNISVMQGTWVAGLGEIFAQRNFSDIW